MQAAEILQRLPAELFPGSPAAVQSKFKDLAKQWHPDVNKSPEATKVFEHLKRSRDYLLSGAAKHVDLHDLESGKTQRYSYLSEHSLSECKVLVGATTVSYLLTGQLRGWGKRVVKRRWEFHDDKQRDEMMRFLPEHHRVMDCREGLLVSYRRQPGDVLLSDLVDYHAARGQRVPPLAVMWMVSGLLNIACYMEISGTAHCAFREEFVVVNPDQHEVRLEGPPLFACRLGERPKFALAETLRDFPVLRTRGYTAKDSRLDLTLIRSLVLRLLGHKSPHTLRTDGEVPKGLTDWVLSPPPRTAVDDYVAWENARGKRAFHIYGLSARDVYVSLL